VYRTGDVVGGFVEGALGRLGTGLAALITVSVPIAIAWGALGIWLGRRQQREAAPVNKLPPSLVNDHLNLGHT
jgi:AAA family ATP:ADP antiporter